MSILSGITNSSSTTSYGIQLAQTSKLGRSLFSLDASIQKGDLATAGDTLLSIVKAYPQYTMDSNDSTDTEDPINKGFATVSNAISNQDVNIAQTAWEDLKKQLADSGVKISDGTATTQKLISQMRESLNASILASLGKTNTDSSFSSLYGLSPSETTATDNLSGMVANWVTYKTSGNNSIKTINQTDTTSSSTASLDMTA